MSAKHIAASRRPFGARLRTPKRRRSLAAAVLALLIIPTWMLGHRAPAQVSPRLPSRANFAWVYDPQPGQTDGTLKPGYFSQSLDNYNARARGQHRLHGLYVYAGDMEMYCPGRDPHRCQAHDMHVYYTGNAPDAATTGRRKGNASVAKYARSMRAGAVFSFKLDVPVIDGSISPKGTLPGFDRLEPAQARAFADKVAEKVCADPNADGVEFDLEPFDVSRRAGQFHFYTRIAEDFASTKHGCVDGSHPRGRFFAIFTTSRRLRPGSAGARNVQAIMHTAHNGYLIDALYDLSGAPVGQRTPVKRYVQLAAREARRMRRWADALKIPYQYGVPAAAGAHEYAQCRGTACPAGDGTSVNQLAYVRAALAAIAAAGARTDPRFLGIALWAWSPSVAVHGMHFLPAQPPPDVVRYLAGNL